MIDVDDVMNNILKDENLCLIRECLEEKNQKEEKIQQLKELLRIKKEFENQKRKDDIFLINIEIEQIKKDILGIKRFRGFEEKTQ